MTKQNQQPVHTIRLRRPWSKQLANRESVDRVDVPETDVPLDSPITSATYTRRFNRPSGLTLASQVQLQVKSWHGDLLSLRVNDHELAPLLFPVDATITDLLTDHNCITIKLAPSDSETDHKIQPVRLSGSVTLAIHQGC